MPSSLTWVAGVDSLTAGTWLRWSAADGRTTRGRFATILSPVRLSDSPIAPSRAPLLGEHSDDILSLAGYSADEVRQLREHKVI